MTLCHKTVVGDPPHCSNISYVPSVVFSFAWSATIVMGYDDHNDITLTTTTPLTQHYHHHTTVANNTTATPHTTTPSSLLIPPPPPPPHPPPSSRILRHQITYWWRDFPRIPVDLPPIPPRRKRGRGSCLLLQPLRARRRDHRTHPWLDQSGISGDHWEDHWTIRYQQYERGSNSTLTPTLVLSLWSLPDIPFP